MATEGSPQSASGGPVPEEDRALLAGLRSGDERAYELLVQKYGARLLSAARRMTGNEDDARDVVQEAYISAFRALEDFKGDARLSTWLHRITINAALMKLRSRRRKPETSIEDMLPRFQEDGHPQQPPRRWSADSDRLLESEEIRAFVRERIDELPDTYRTVLLLRDIEELDTAETAAILDITTNAVKIRLHRARLALRELLDRRFAADTETDEELTP